MIAVDVMQATIMNIIHVSAVLHLHVLFAIMTMRMIIGGHLVRKLMRSRIDRGDCK